MLTLHVFATGCPSVFSWSIDEWRIAADGGFDGGPNTIAEGHASSTVAAYGAGVKRAKSLGLRVACGDTQTGYELVYERALECETMDRQSETELERARRLA